MQIEEPDICRLKALRFVHARVVDEYGWLAKAIECHFNHTLPRTFIPNVVLHKPIIDAALFSLAIAVGITPQLLPAVVSTSLAAGSRRMSRRKVLVKRLVCIEDLGNVDVLFTDKTGTLTLGRIDYMRAVPSGDSTTPDEVVRWGLLSTETTGADGPAVGGNPLDSALWESPAAATQRAALTAYTRVGLLPFDHERRMSLFTDASRTELAAADAEGALKQPFDALAGPLVDRMLYADSKVRLPDHPVMISDRMSMAHGLEARSPFMDHELAEYAARLPWTLKVRGRQLRYLQRKLAARYLPPEILSRPKQGFSSALPYILKGEYREMYARYLQNSELVRAGVLARAPIEHLVGEHTSGRVDHGNRLWLLINSEIWYRMMILGESRESFRTADAQSPIATAA